MADDGFRRATEQVQQQALRGSLPRHVIDFDLGPDALDSRYEDSCRRLLEAARSASDEICDTLEHQCHELTSLEDAGYSERIRYLTAVACVATDVDLRLRTDGGLDRLSYLRTVHHLVDDWREGASYDLSNVLGPMEFLPRVGRSRDEVLGFWIWLNLGDGNEHRHLTWVKSTMRFATGYGKEVLRRFGPDSDEDSDGSAHHAPSGRTAVSRAAARRIAENHLAEHRVPRATGEVREVLAWDEIEFRRPDVYGYTESFWPSHWIAYLEQKGDALRESLIVAVHRETGDIGYVGGANDEG